MADLEELIKEWLGQELPRPSGDVLDKWAEHWGTKRLVITEDTEGHVDVLTGLRMETDESLRRRIVQLIRRCADG